MRYKRARNYNPLGLLTPNIDTLSLRLVPEESVVLDIGCGGGYLGKIMRQKLRCTVIGVENDTQAVKTAAKNINHVISGDIEDTRVMQNIKQYAPFDIIYASAIFEHLISPDPVIRKLTQFLKKEGSLIVTLPNIAHYSTRFMLLLGNFTYQDSGICDRTHLHFYTLQTARRLLEENNFRIIHQDFEYFGTKPLTLLFRFFPNFFAYQFLFKAIPKNNG